MKWIFFVAGFFITLKIVYLVATAGDKNKRNIGTGRV